MIAKYRKESSLFQTLLVSLEVNWLRYVSRPSVVRCSTVVASGGVAFALPPNHSFHRTRQGRLATETLVGRAGELRIR
jgi:hypothetical protein